MSIKSGLLVTLMAVALVSGTTGACGGGGGGTGGTTGAAGTSSGGSTGGGGTGGATLPVIASCMAFCNAEKDCNPTSTVADCIDYRCVNPAGLMPFSAQSAGCQAVYRAWYDCLAAQTPICDPNNPSANIPGNCVSQTNALASGNCTQS